MLAKRSVSGIVIAASLLLGACGRDDVDDGDAADAADAADGTEDEAPTSIASSDEVGDVDGDDGVDDAPVDEPAGSGGATGATATSVCGDFDPAVPDVEAVDCADPHDAELAGMVPVPDGLRPGVIPDPIAVDACRAAAETIAGGAVWATGLTVLPFDSTTAGASTTEEIECWLVSPVDGALTGSLRRVEPATALGELVSVFSMEPGQCYVIEQDAFGFLTLVRPGGCDEVGAQRLIALVPVEGETFPGNDAVETLGREACADDPGTSEEFFYLTPFEAEWALGQRVIVCSTFAGEPDGEADGDGPLVHDHDDDGDDHDDERAGDHGDSESDEGYRYPAGTCYRNLSDSQDPIGTVTDCDEPHRWEYVGNVDPVVRTIPDALADARALFVRTCEQAVTEATGMSIAEPGVSLAYRVEGELGGWIVGTVACFAGADGGDYLVGPLDGDIGAALGDAEPIWQMVPGTCFAFLPDTFDLGLEVACDDQDARMHIGWYDLPLGPYPGEDELRAIRSERCTDLLEAGGLDADPDSVSGTIPSEPDWRNARRRMTTCDALPG